MTRYVRNMSKSCVCRGGFFQAAFPASLVRQDWEFSRIQRRSFTATTSSGLSDFLRFLCLRLWFFLGRQWLTLYVLLVIVCCVSVFFCYSEHDIPEMWDQYTRIRYILLFLFWLPETSEDLGTISLADRIASRSLSTGMVRVASLLAGWFVGIDELQIHFRPVFLLVI